MDTGRAVLVVLVGAAVGAALLSAVTLFRPQPVGDLALVGAGVGGLLAAVGVLVRRFAPPESPPTGPGDPYLNTLDRTELRAFRREALRGPVPTDPDRRAAAIRYVRRTMDNENAGRLTDLAWYAVTLLLAVVNTSRSPWSALLAAGVLGSLVWRIRRPGFLRRRLARLRDG